VLIELSESTGRIHIGGNGTGGTGGLAFRLVIVYLFASCCKIIPTSSRFGAGISSTPAGTGHSFSPQRQISFAVHNEPQSRSGLVSLLIIGVIIHPNVKLYQGQTAATYPQNGRSFGNHQVDSRLGRRNLISVIPPPDRRPQFLFISSKSPTKLPCR
jgi:hypothetical protein